MFWAGTEGRREESGAQLWVQVKVMTAGIHACFFEHTGWRYLPDLLRSKFK